MSNIPSANNKIQLESTQYRAPVSENLVQTMGGSINYALDGIATNATSISNVASDLADTNSTLATKTCVRSRSTATNGGVTLGDDNFHTGGAVIDSYTFTVSGSATDEIAMVYLGWDYLETSRYSSSVQVRISNNSQIALQYLNNRMFESDTDITTSVMLPLTWFTDRDATIEVRLYAVPDDSGSHQRNRVKLQWYWLVLDRSAALSGT